MRHVYIRGILALIWLAAAVVSGISGNLEWAGLYVLMGAAFGYSAYTTWKKGKNRKKGIDHERKHSGASKPQRMVQ